MAQEIMYQVKNWEAGFTELEVNIRRQVESQMDESRRFYTTETELSTLEEYRNTNENFKADQYFYVFDEDKMVGFMRASVQDGEKHSNVSMAYITKGHEEADDVLFNFVIKALRDKGIEELRKDRHENNFLEKEWLIKHNFDVNDLSRLYSKLSVDEIYLEDNDHFDIEDFQEDLHQEAVLDLYISQGYERERIETQFKWLKRDFVDKNKLLSWKVAKKDGILVGQSVAFLYEEGGDSGQINAVTMNVEDNDKSKLIGAIYSKHLEKAKENNVKNLELNLFQQVVRLRPLYEKIGVNFEEFTSYTLKF